jgi:hypothetical protein
MSLPSHLARRGLAISALFVIGLVGLSQSPGQQPGRGKGGKKTDQPPVEAVPQVRPGEGPKVERDVQAGTALRVSQTPTMFVTKGMKQTPWTYWTDYNLFKGYLNDLLK